MTAPASPKQRIEVAIGILTRLRADHWQVLIAQRPPHVVLGGYWEFPGGKIKPHESPPQCAQREFLEELGLSVRVGCAWPVVEYTYTHGHVRMHPFSCDCHSGRPQNLQVTQHRWVEADLIHDYRFPPANTHLVDHVAEALRQKALPLHQSPPMNKPCSWDSLQNQSRST